jgi:hypothetical protein
MVLRILPQRLIEKLDATARLLELFQQDHLMDIVPGEAIWTGHDDSVQGGLFEPIPQAIQPRPIEGGATIALITEHILRTQGLALSVHVRSEAFHLLFNGLGQHLPLG